MRKINHRKAQRRAMLYMVGISAAVLALSYLGKVERDRQEAVELAAEEAVRIAMIPDGYHPGATVEFELSPTMSEGEALFTSAIQSWFDGEWEPQVAADCMIAWWLFDPQISGEISMEVTYGSAGPQKLLVSQFSTIPPTASSCFVEALNGLEWPASSQGASVNFTVASQRDVVTPNTGSALGAAGFE